MVHSRNMTKITGEQEMTTLCLRVTCGQKQRWKDKARKADMTLTKFIRLAMDQADVTVDVSVGLVKPRAPARPVRPRSTTRATGDP